MKGFSLCVCALGAVFVPLASCSSNTTTTTDSSPDAANDAADSATNDDGSDAATTLDYCEAATAYFARCNRTTACDQALLAQCNDVRATYGDAYAAAQAACFPEQPCKATTISDTCVRSKLATAATSTAQKKLAQDFCTACPTGGTSCVSTFYKIGTTTADDGVGAPILQASDALVIQIDSTCLAFGSGDAGACKDVFVNCALGVIYAAEVPDPPECN